MTRLFLTLALLPLLSGCSSMTQPQVPEARLEDQQRWREMADGYLSGRLAYPPPAAPITVQYTVPIQPRINSDTIAAAAEAVKVVGELVGPLVLPGVGAAVAAGVP